MYFLFLVGLIINAQNFTDVTASNNIHPVSTITEKYGTGASIVDYDNDGDLDIFLCTEFRVPKRLYQNDGNGNFTEVANATGIVNEYRNRTSLWFDYNGDNLLDLILLGDCYFESGCTDLAEIFVYKQNENNTFDLDTSTGITFGNKYNINGPNDLSREFLAGGLAAADINNDGWLDLLVSIWGAPMTLFLNNGDNTFSDISTSSNLGQTILSRHQPVFHDFDNDGLIDIYINVDFQENEFWRNLGNNQFEEIAADINADNDFNEMGMAVGDYDNDGDFDIYSTNITRSDGTNTSYNIFLKNTFSDSNTLGFTEVANNPNFNVGASGWDWGTTFFDANNDGFVDLATTNGWEDNNWAADNSRLWQNVDGLLFSDISTAANFNDNWNATSLLAFDMDRDGDLDLLQTMRQNGSNLTPFRLYENDVSSTSNSNYLVVKPRMNGTNHHAIGAVVKISYDNEQTAMRLITAGISFYGQEPAEAFFGLASNTIVDEIIIEWPDNTTTTLNDIAVNQVLTVTNDNALSTTNNKANAIRLFPNPVENIFNITADLNISQIEIYNLLGQKVFQQSLNSKNETIDISQFSKGNYFAKIKTESNSEITTIRILKQ